MSPAIKGTDPRAWLQEIKTNRRLQVGLAVIPLLVWILWPSSPAKPSRPATGIRSASTTLDERQARELDKLPNLSRLNRAGELPTDARLSRDIFLFDAPPPPPKPIPPPPPPPPPTPEQLAAEALRKARDLENSFRPKDLRYLGYLGTHGAGRLGAFMRGEDPVTLKVGDLANPHWRLVRLTDLAAEFQDLKYQDLRLKIDAMDSQGGGHGFGQAHSNEF